MIKALHTNLLNSDPQKKKIISGVLLEYKNISLLEPQGGRMSLTARGFFVLFFSFLISLQERAWELYFSGCPCSANHSCATFAPLCV